MKSPFVTIALMLVALACGALIESTRWRKQVSDLCEVSAALRRENEAARGVIKDLTAGPKLDTYRWPGTAIDLTRKTCPQCGMESLWLPK